MSRLLCVGSSSKLPEKGGEPVTVGILSSREPPVNNSGHSKPRSPKSQSSTQPQGKQLSVISDKGQVKDNSSRSKAGAVLQAPSQADKTTHGEEKLAKHASPVGAEVQIVSAEFVEKMHEDGPILKVPQYLGVPECQNGQSTSEEESGDDEECGDDETAEHRAPIELLAEFLKAVMGKDYPLAKKLCQMILIYEPENPEAKHFLPLIEERILIEESQEESSSEDKSDETDEESTEEDGDDGDDDEEDDDDEESSSCDSDEELTDSNSSSSDEKEEHISECSRAPLPP